MNRYWQILLGAGLVFLSVVFYLAHYFIFRDSHHIFIYMVGDIAFVPIEVLMVTLILHQLLARREKAALLKKLNMVIGAFFTAVGTELLERLGGFSTDVEGMRKPLVPEGGWTAEDFERAKANASKTSEKLDVRAGDLPGLAELLGDQRDFLLRLLENPNLLEHEAFTDLLWAVFHLAEELSARGSFDDLPESDLDHLTGDIVRVHSQLVVAWLAYMSHLKAEYPYLFSLAMRTNPFDPQAQAEVS